ncbi:MAG: HAMP domain-containing protein [Curvibacter lanceolatus]|uniref:methyl-accepting chemotaxis protein n=1 Tax=Curvibacter lanceolatus TaxID=86182 RepID=UPI0023546C43|nr:methyl-accepting chemotaxis protein [Curvibacter lanceolatus]MBV5294184.1 HAMP domain-containing protein [Curvibacter lanceolatus]
MKLSHVSIRQRFVALLALFLLGFLVTGFWSLRTLSYLKVNGPLYEHIVQGKDLVADILPPPEYVLEPYLVCFQLSSTTDPARQAKLLEQWAVLRKAYDERHAYWEKAQLGPELSELLLQRAHESAQAFLASAEKNLLPAVRQGDAGATHLALANLSGLYEAHRQAIDATVVVATRMTEQGEAAAAQEIEHNTALLILISALSVLASLGLAVLIIRSITGPLLEAVKVSHRVAAGDLSEPIEVSGRDETAQLQGALRSMQDSLVQTVGQVRGNARQVALASAEIASGNQDLSERTERQASALEETAAAMAELDEAVRQNADNARQAKKLAHGAREVAARGSSVVGEVVETMKSINDSSRQISDIVGTIDGIAFQTNILALNAAVEAARAGEQGRGFAVVAGEVRRLAQRSAESAREVRALIGASVERVDQGSRLVDAARRAMDDVVVEIERVSEVVGAISDASAEQSTGVSEVVAAVGQIDQVTQQNAALVEESAAAASSLRQQAQELLKGVSLFRLPVGADGADDSQARLPSPERASPSRLAWSS